jgi:hypothetical protein
MAEREIVYTEHEKLSKIKDESQALGAFIEWLESEGVHMPAKWHRRSMNEWLARYFEIDLNKLEEEKLHMLNRLREENKKGDK